MSKEYSLEWGWHTNSESIASTASNWKPQPTLLGRKSDEGGKVDIAATGDLRCEVCPRRGSWGTTATNEIYGRKMCRDCAVKELGIGDLPGGEQIKHLDLFPIK